MFFVRKVGEVLSLSLKSRSLFESIGDFPSNSLVELKMAASLWLCKSICYGPAWLLVFSGLGGLGGFTMVGASDVEGLLLLLCAV